MQCQALGGRIAALLRARELLFEQTLKDELGNSQSQGACSIDGKQTATQQHPRRQKKHRVIIHSSPFLRCVQTSVAIGAGISQYQGYNELRSGETTTPSAQSSSKATKSGKPKLASIKDEDEEKDESSSSNAPTDTPQHTLYVKPRLRIDAFLGEWLSPDYYECITSPPNSVMMVAGAKADLLRRGERIQVREESARKVSPKGNFPGGWGSPTDGVEKNESDDEALQKRFEGTSITSPALSGRNRARTHADASDLEERWAWMAQKPSTFQNGARYLPLVPPYAISPSEPIPPGYVQHARDACIEVDFQWDSMRPPLDWGDGGELGEEWSAMHKRFRKGLHKMIAWYSRHHESGQQLHGHSRVLHPHHHETDDKDTDVVVVLVTHGAGCNALIGALTNQPVLLDVSMASLTMAVQRDVSQANSKPLASPMLPYTTLGPPSTITPSLPRHENERPFSNEYTVTLTASTEHLTNSPFTPLSLPDLLTKPANPTESSMTRRSSRRRFTPIPAIPHDRSSSLSHLPTSYPAEIQPRPGLHRSNTTFEPPTRTVTESATASTGLWNRPAPATVETKPRTWSLVGAGSTNTQSPPSTNVIQSPTSIISQTSEADDITSPVEYPKEHRPSIGLADGFQGAGFAEEASEEANELAIAEGSTLASEEIAKRQRGVKRRWTTTEQEFGDPG